MTELPPPHMRSKGVGACLFSDRRGTRILFAHLSVTQTMWGKRGGERFHEDSKALLQSLIGRGQQEAHLPILVRMQHKPLWAQGMVGGECVSCNCISSVVIWTEFVCIWAFFSHCWDMKKAMHKQNHVMRGFCSRGADVSHHTTPIRSWTLYNNATVKQSSSRKRLRSCRVALQ